MTHKIGINGTNGNKLTYVRNLTDEIKKELSKEDFTVSIIYLWEMSGEGADRTSLDVSES